MSTFIKNHHWSFAWFCTAVFCIIFAIVYECFAHGVTSNAMIYAFVYPFFLGAAPCFMLEKMEIPMPHRLYQDGVLALMLASILQGILEIYGTSSDLILYFYVLGAALIIIGLIISFHAHRKNHAQ